MALGLRRASVTSSSALTATTMTEEEVPPSILLNAHEGSGYLPPGQSTGGDTPNASSSHSSLGLGQSGSSGRGTPDVSVSNWRHYVDNPEYTGSSSSLPPRERRRASSSARVSFAPLPEIPQELRRHNSITLGVAARRHLLHGASVNGTEGYKAKGQTVQVVYMTDEEWDRYQKQYDRSSDVVDLGDLAKTGAKKLWKKVRSNSDSTSADPPTPNPSPGTKKTMWRPGKRRPSPSSPAISVTSPSPVSPLSPAATAPVSPGPDLGTVEEEDDKVETVLVGERRVRSPPPMPVLSLDDNDVLEEEEEEEEDEDAEAAAEGSTPEHATVAGDGADHIEPRLPSRSPPRPHRSASALDLHRASSRSSAVLGFDSNLHHR